ncbi:hypothetical protein HanRHA438_Chr16g0742841 [Helianthus annuus]|nr:hypothetical protein HanRHA438_Chr16g0742841 [Helianthus annuus]
MMCNLSLYPYANSSQLHLRHQSVSRVIKTLPNVIFRFMINNHKVRIIQQASHRVSILDLLMYRTTKWFYSWWIHGAPTNHPD